MACKGTKNPQEARHWTTDCDNWKALKLPVLLQASYVSSHGGVKLGTLWDLCSTDDYITFKKADELALKGRKAFLTIEGVGGVETTITTKLYDVPVFVERKCYGIEKIAEAGAPPDEASYRELCDKFNLRMEDIVRLDEIDLLI